MVRKCIYCESEILNEDLFCHECGEPTSKGLLYLQDENNVKSIINGNVFKHDKKFRFLLSLIIIGIIFFLFISFIRGKDLYKSYFYIEKRINNILNGYNSSIIKTDNIYNDINVYNENEAKELIINDFEEQKWKCSNSLEVSLLEYDLKNNYDIYSVCFCDMEYDVSKNIYDVIKSVYSMFPSVINGLTNITITNSDSNNDYIAYFQPLYQFVNINNDINLYNKVNKTQILLNSYYYLNSNILNGEIRENWYVKDADYYSIIAHEMGHYITFELLLNDYNLDNIMFVSKDNELLIDKVISEFDSGEYSFNIVNNALYNYNIKYNLNLNIDEFALLISNYAGSKNDSGNLITDETIAEAIHDYYLHGINSSSASMEIINVIKSKFAGEL